MKTAFFILAGLFFSHPSAGCQGACCPRSECCIQPFSPASESPAEPREALTLNLLPEDPLPFVSTPKKSRLIFQLHLSINAQSPWLIPRARIP